MLTTYLNNLPFSKFVLIKDTLDQRGKDILRYMVDSHNAAAYKIHYFVFEGNFKSAKESTVYRNVEFYDFVSNARGWFGNSVKQDFMTTVSETDISGCVIVIDSLSHIIFEYGFVAVYRYLQKLLENGKGVLRIIALLHLDILENPNQICQYLDHLSTFMIALEPNFHSNKNRVSYTYKKPSGKVIKQVEEYHFENGHLKSEPIKKIDPKTLVQDSLNQVLPENLTTFRIGLDEKEKQSRAQLVLPYLPKENKTDEVGEVEIDGHIFYQFDNTDDWDEEDPDDDLDL